MERIYRGAKANGYQFHRDEIVHHLDRTLTPYWRQFIKGIEETFDYQTSPDLLLRCMRERWRVNCEDVRDNNKMPGYEPNPGNVITIPKVDYEGNYVEEDPSEEYNPVSYLAIDLKPNLEEKEREGTGKKY
ncbi:Hypothetical predicted protein [Olea europaea subsp. europaea]|uniref:Uncharacterized protein n=1 Tax=Olea europaea subsp. europaea TaxID=158383 RepID=A0A8S0SCE2_OLEEU|nr:Hypothetical predicted protein [Olea europaea subsp. europaea]